MVFASQGEKGLRVGMGGTAIMAPGGDGTGSNEEPPPEWTGSTARTGEQIGGGSGTGARLGRCWEAL